jgi:hypothetical protein
MQRAGLRVGPFALSSELADFRLLRRFDDYSIERKTTPGRGLGAKNVDLGGIFSPPLVISMI